MPLRSCQRRRDRPDDGTCRTRHSRCDPDVYRDRRSVSGDLDKAIVFAQSPQATLPVPLAVRNEMSNQAEALRANQLAMNNFALEMMRMNIEVSELRAALRSPQTKNDSKSASFYNDAMAYARRGLTAAGIAARCHMSLGEAELVIALVRDSSHSASNEGKPAFVPLLTDSDDRRPSRAAA